MTPDNTLAEVREALQYANENLSSIDGDDDVTAEALAKLDSLIEAQNRQTAETAQKDSVVGFLVDGEFLQVPLSAIPASLVLARCISYGDSEKIISKIAAAFALTPEQLKGPRQTDNEGENHG